MDREGVVIDTNVIYSALRDGGRPSPKTGKRAPPGIIVDWAWSGHIVRHVSDALLREHERVLLEGLDDINESRRKVGAKAIKRGEIIDFVDDWADGATLVSITLSTRPALEGRAASDEMLLELTAASGGLLITGNKKHFEQVIKPYRIRVMTPGEYVRARA